MVNFYLRIAIFLFGVLLGILLAKICVYSIYKHNVPEKQSVPSYEVWFRKQGYKRKYVSWDTMRYNKCDNNPTESEVLFKKIKVFCIVFVYNDKNFEGAKHTWLNGCNNFQAISIKTKKNKFIAVKRTKENSSWFLLCETLKNIIEKYDWYLIVYDTTFVILENLRYFVAPFNSTENYYFGYAVKFWSTVYNSGQAGYVISKGTLKSIKTILKKECSNMVYWNREDFYLGKLLSKLNIFPQDTRDSEGLSTFYPYNWYIIFFPGESTKYYSTSIYPLKCCSQYPITFQAIEGSKMYTYHYLLYDLQIFTHGIFGNKKYIPKAPDDLVWKTFLKDQNVDNNITSKGYFELWSKLIEDPNSFAAHMKREMNLGYE